MWLWEEVMVMLYSNNHVNTPLEKQYQLVFHLEMHNLEINAICENLKISALSHIFLDFEFVLFTSQPKKSLT